MTRLHLLATLALMVPTLLVPAAAQPAGAGRGAVSAPAADAPDEPEATSKSRPRRSALRFGAENVLAEVGCHHGHFQHRQRLDLAGSALRPVAARSGLGIPSGRHGGWAGANRYPRFHALAG
jgi:hypothetical protein